jgi:hypothetical protein
VVAHPAVQEAPVYKYAQLLFLNIVVHSLAVVLLALAANEVDILVFFDFCDFVGFKETSVLFEDLVGCEGCFILFPFDPLDALKFLDLFGSAVGDALLDVVPASEGVECSGAGVFGAVGMVASDVG